MKKFKKFISLVLSCAIVLSLCIPAFAAENDPVLMSESDSYEIIQRYPNEISYISEISGIAIHSITRENLATIKDIIFENDLLSENSGYSALLEDIAQAATLYQLENNEDAIVSNISAELSNGSRAIDSGFRIENKTVKNLTSYKPLVGHVGDYLRINESKTINLTVTASVGTVIDGYTLGLAASASVSSTFSGPSANTSLYSGVAYATHAVAYATLWGVLQQVSYDVVEISTGNVIKHEYYTAIESTTQKALSYTLFASLGNPTYVNHARYKTTLSFVNQSAFERNAQNSPDYFIN